MTVREGCDRRERGVVVIVKVEVEVGGADLSAGPRQARKRSQVGRWWMACCSAFLRSGAFSGSFLEYFVFFFFKQILGSFFALSLLFPAYCRASEWTIHYCDYCSVSIWGRLEGTE